jgi:hypothetical protein
MARCTLRQVRATPCDALRSLSRCLLSRSQGLHDAGDVCGVVEGVHRLHEAQRGEARAAHFGQSLLANGRRSARRRDGQQHILLLPPNLTHLLQPADSIVFAAVKREMDQLAGDLSANGTAIAKHNVAALIWQAFSKGCKPPNVRAAFAKTGVWPINRLAVPDSSLTLEASVSGLAKPALALEEQQARLLAVPVVGKFLSAPRRAKKTKKQAEVDKQKLTTAMVLTLDSLRDAIAAKPGNKKKAALKEKADAAAAAAAAGGDSSDGGKEEKKAGGRKRKRVADSDEEKSDGGSDAERGRESDSGGGSEDSLDGSDSVVRKGASSAHAPLLNLLVLRRDGGGVYAEGCSRHRLRDRRCGGHRHRRERRPGVPRSLVPPDGRQIRAVPPARQRQAL